MNPNKKNAENADFFLCEICDFHCFKKSNWTTHLSTRKHKILTNPNEKEAEKNFQCDCGKKYKHNSSLCAHKKKCNYTDTINEILIKDGKPVITHELILNVLQQNQELQQMMMEQNKAIMEMSKNSQIITTNNNNVNSHNKTFNLQVFLNETCKDAMNIMDFVDSIQLQLTDLENVGKNGFVKGISNIIMKNLNALDITMRPVHCSDQKRETIYIKDQNQWHNDSKELPENQKLKKAIRQIANKNICLIPEWKKLYPDCVYADSRKSDIYNQIVYEAMDHNEVNSEKIIKRIAKEVVIDSTFKKSGSKSSGEIF
jgi:hypothetical protein